MRLPNGYGSVYKLKGNRRNPWVARKTLDYTIDWDKKTCNPKYKWIGYYRTKAEALAALAKYNQAPYDLKGEGMTLSDLFEAWLKSRSAKLTDNSIESYRRTFKLCAPIADKQAEAIKLADFQRLAEESGKNTPTLRRWKVVLGQMYDYAVRNEYVPTDRREMVRFIDLSFSENPNKITKTAFTQSEIQHIWNHADTRDTAAILVLLYTGLRISEFLALRKEDVDLKRRSFFVRESKTAAGIREVPIAEKTVPLWQMLLAQEGELVFPSQRGKQYIYTNYRNYSWTPAVSSLGIKHSIHETRHTCITLLTEAGVDSRIVKQLVGHAPQDVTEGYTHISLEAKLEAINKI